MRLPEAVLWDMDGTLVDTEAYWMEAEYALVAEHGGTWTEQDAHDLVGNPLLVSAQLLRTRGGVRLTDEEIVDRLLTHVVRRVGDHVPWQPGALELLEDLARHGVPTALVTMSWTALAHTVVDALPAGSFATLVTGDQVTNGKPHPEPYLEAAARLDVDPRRCVAIEDSVTGLLSAEAAGVPTVAVPHLVPIPPSPGRLIVESLALLDTAALAAVLEASLSAAAVDVSET
ncbi:MAG: HAD family hydrolase [Actinomycetes bacterium]